MTKQREIPLLEVLNIWENINTNMGRTFHIYIDNPFCLKECKYCIYKPIETKIGSDIYTEYYKKTLPNEIERFRHVIEKYPFESIYFGGGTPSHMTKEIMIEVFEKIPKFKEIHHKMFEAHPTFLNKEKIDILAEYGFTFISLGVQSFNKELLEKYGRFYNGPEKIKELVEYTRNKGIEVNCDIMALLKLEDGTPDIENAIEDLYTLCNVVKPNSITISPLQQTWEEKEEQEVIKLVKSLRKGMVKFLLENPEWETIDPKLLSLNDTNIKNANTTDYIMITDSSIEGMAYNSSKVGGHGNQITLALGGSDIKQIYSYIGDDITYYTIRDYKSKTNKYIVDK